MGDNEQFIFGQMGQGPLTDESGHDHAVYALNKKINKNVCILCSLWNCFTLVL